MSETDRLTTQVITRKSGHTSNWWNAGLQQQQDASTPGRPQATHTVITQNNLARSCRVHVTRDAHLKLDMPATWWPEAKPPAWCLSLQQATVLAGLSSTVFAFLIFLHEVVLEGGFDARNYVVLAFCVVWIIVTVLLFLAVHKAASFLLLPWLVLTCVLTPLLMVGIVAGGKVIGLCLHNRIQEACDHERHIFGTLDHFVASVKLGVLIFMTITNCIFLFVVYRFFCKMNKKSQPSCQTIWLKSSVPETKPLRYHRIRDAVETDSSEPLFQSQDSKAVVT